MYKIASIILREYNIGCTPRELYWRMSWIEIMCLLYTSKENTQEQEQARKREEVSYKGNKKIIRKTMPVKGAWNHFRRKGFKE